MWTPFFPAFFLPVLASDSFYMGAREIPTILIMDVPINLIYIYHGQRELRKKEKGIRSQSWRVKLLRSSLWYIRKGRLAFRSLVP